MIQKLYTAYQASHRVTTDSRQITPGCLFFALRGEHFDGNTFAQQALEQGAALSVVSVPPATPDPRIIVVDDVLATLQQLAAYHRSMLDMPVVGITGTNGKTTTKELVHAVLSRRYRTAATAGNFNNHLGVPLTLLAIPPDSQLAIVEMGANHPGEIADLCAIADPDCGLITNVGRAHLEGFGSFEGVVHTKTELYRHLAAKHGLAFVEASNTTLLHEAHKLATLPDVPTLVPACMPGLPSTNPTVKGPLLGICTYGSASEADVRGTLTSCSPYLNFYFEVDDSVYTVRTHLLGSYNFANCMAAVAVGLHFGVEPFDIKQAIEDYIPQNHRSEYCQTSRGNQLYLDCYNANPSSMEAALDSFQALYADTKMAILGSMKELGHTSKAEHRKLVKRVEEMHLQAAYLVGPEFEDVALGTGMLHFADTTALAAHLAAHPINSATVLVKGSNSNRLWTLQDLL